MSGADVEVYLSQVHDGSVSSGFRALYEERLLLDVTLLIEEHHFQVNSCRSRRSNLVLLGSCKHRANFNFGHFNNQITQSSE